MIIIITKAIFPQPKVFSSYQWLLLNDFTYLSFFTPLQKPLRYRRAISYDSKEYYMRLLSGNPGMYQHSVEHTTEGETTQHEPEHGEDTIARVKGTETIPWRARYGV